MEAAISHSQHSIYGVGLILAPLLFAASFFWINGGYGRPGGNVLLLSMVLWMAALVCLFGLARDKMPNSLDHFRGPGRPLRPDLQCTEREDHEGDLSSGFDINLREQILRRNRD